MNVVSGDFRRVSDQPETLEIRAIRWRAEAITNRNSLWPLNRLRLALGGQIHVGFEQLCPGIVDNPEMPLHIFNCPSCHGLGKGYRNGFTDSANGRYFVCNSCNVHFDAHELAGSVMHFLGNFVAMVRLAWGFRTKRKPALP
ncbi:MAG: hypothetical protein Q7R71_01945 [bacterium]|nr:hypothetical protein [bacterium]